MTNSMNTDTMLVQTSVQTVQTEADQSNSIMTSQTDNQSIDQPIDQSLSLSHPQTSESVKMEDPSVEPTTHDIPIDQIIVPPVKQRIKPKLDIPINVKNRVLAEKIIEYPFCSYCVLRYLNIRSSAALVQSLDDLTATIQTFFPSTNHYEQPDYCISCCNLLPTINQTVAEFLKSDSITRQHFDQFSVWISLAISLMIRNRIFPLIFESPHVELKECVKWLLSDAISRHHQAKYQPNSQMCSFAIRLDAQLSLDDGEKSLVEQLTPNLASRKQRYGYKADDLINQSNCTALLQSITKDQAIALAQQYRNNVNTPNQVLIKYDVNREPILLIGNYCKYARTLSQTPWTLDEDEEVDDPEQTNNQSNNKRNKANDGGQVDVASAAGDATTETPKVNRKSATSVEEEITRHIIPLFDVDLAVYRSNTPTNQSNNQVTQLRFSSNGREDLDVRMLGAGRPFCIEVLHAKRGLKANSPEVKQLEQSINQSSSLVQVLNLHVGTPAEFKAMKASIESKRKTYRCVIYTATPCTKETIEALNRPFSEEGLVLAQKTPIRVIHRRSALTRNKTIHMIESTWLNEHWFTLEVSTSAGTYVKEFVHGDRGRTVPSISSMLNNSMCECVLLDVMNLLH